VEDHVRELVDAYQLGETTYFLPERFGIDRFIVSVHLERAGVLRRRKARVGG
jgi:hypothetical protein